MKLGMDFRPGHFTILILDFRGDWCNGWNTRWLVTCRHCRVRARFLLAHEDLLTTVKRGKRQWYGYVSRSSGLAKTSLQGTVKGGRRQGRQRKRWEGNIREWTGLEFAKSQRAVENREKWRKLAAKSSVVPQRPSWLWDKWWWWWWWWWWWNRTGPAVVSQDIEGRAGLQLVGSGVWAPVLQGHSLVADIPSLERWARGWARLRVAIVVEKGCRQREWNSAMNCEGRLNAHVR